MKKETSLEQRPIKNRKTIFNMSELYFLNGQPVTVTTNYNQFTEGDKYIVAKTDRIQGQYNCVVKDNNGNIKGSLPQNYLTARKNG